MTTLTPDRIGGSAPHVTGDDDDERRVCWEGHAYSGIRELGVAESGNFCPCINCADYRAARRAL